MTKLSDFRRQIVSMGSTALSRWFTSGVEPSVDDLDEMSPEDALSMLGAIEDASIDAEDDVNQAAADEIRYDVGLLRVDAPRAELALLEQLDDLMVDRAVEGISSVFRRVTRGRERVQWTSREDIVIGTEQLISQSDLRLEIARYLDLWASDESSAPAPQVALATTWARRAVVRMPLLFRHARVIDVTDRAVTLIAQPRPSWSATRRTRWAARRAVERREAVA